MLLCPSSVGSVSIRLLLVAVSLVTMSCGMACAQNTTATATPASVLPQGTSVLPNDPLFSSQVGGLERTDAVTATVPVTGQKFSKALQVTTKKDAPDTNATQLTIGNTVAVKKGEAMIATFAVRGLKADGKSPAEVMFLFEGSTDPWTKSTTRTVTTPKDGKSWRQVTIPFTMAGDFQPGQVMASLRFAFGAQTVEVADLKVMSLGTGRSIEEMHQLAADLSPLGNATVKIDLKAKRQVMEGFGGNYCQARYGYTEKIDAVGQYTLDNLTVVAARIGLPLNNWTPEKGVYKEEGQPKAAMELMGEMAQRKVPIIATIWEGPLWMIPGKPEQSGRVLEPALYDDCIAAIVKFLVTARDKYNAPVDYFSFNEADYGVNFKFTSETIVAFVKKAIPQFQAAGLKTKFLIGDTANGANLAAYVAPLLADSTLAPFLGPIAFHCWDVLDANEKSYTAIADLGMKYNRPVWCTEAGFDSQLWQQQNPWPEWDSALRLAQAYARTLNLTRASTMLYWTYQDNYPLVMQDGKGEYPTFKVIKLMQNAFPKGATVCETMSDNDGLLAIATIQPNGKKRTVLLVNTVGAGKVTLNGIGGGRSAHFNILKSTSDTAASADIAYRNGKFQLELPARSVTVVTVE